MLCNTSRMLLLDGFFYKCSISDPNQNDGVCRPSHPLERWTDIEASHTVAQYLVDLFQHFTFKYFRRYSPISERALSNSEFITPL